MRATDAIYALASGAGRAGVAVIRTSGDRLPDLIAPLLQSLPTPHKAQLKILRDADRSTIDRALVLYMPKPHSFTGEHVVELHVHGGAAIIRAVSIRLQSLGLRPAEPGEFTRRAFINGKIDLLQAEAIADLVDAETEAQRKQAAAQLEGRLSGRVDEWRRGLLTAAAYIEADIDFPDEADIGEEQAARALPFLCAVVDDMRRALAESEGARATRDGYRIALVGRPNAGKSTLFNALVGEERAIVTDIAGTTRDIVDARRVMGGHAVVLQDTAGLHETSDRVEAEGIRRAKQAADHAACRILVVGPGDKLDDAMTSLLREGDFVWWSRSSQTPSTKMFHVKHFAGDANCADDLAALSEALSQQVSTACASSDVSGLTRARHAENVTSAIHSLERAISALDVSPEVAGECVRQAVDALSFLLGRLDVDEILDHIFREFCIGK
jgi:tRNA modification GTPase